MTSSLVYNVARIKCGRSQLICFESLQQADKSVCPSVSACASFKWLAVSASIVLFLFTLPQVVQSYDPTFRLLLFLPVIHPCIIPSVIRLSGIRSVFPFV